MPIDFLRSDWDSEWRPIRDRAAAVAVLVGFSLPALFWFRMTLDELAAGSNGKPFPTLLIGLLWIGVVLAAFGSSLTDAR